MFPFDQPAPTAFYLVIYLVTMVLHVVPMNYVLAGSTYLAVRGLWDAATGKQSPADEQIGDTLRDWLPFALSVAITAGVAPLLFIQILYKQSFYTANLLLFHRWMAILPILIAAFYLLYVQKSNWLKQRDHRGRSGLALRAGVSTGIVACFAFVAWSWTENHLLSLQGQDTWSTHYAGASWWYADQELLPRLAVWYLGAFPTFAAIVAWQHRDTKQQEASLPALRSIAMGTLAASAVALAVYFMVLKQGVRAEILDNAGGYVIFALIGGSLQVASWWHTRKDCSLCSRTLLMMLAGVLLATGSMTVVREVRRLASIDITQLYPEHAAASQIGGLFVFLLFAALNTAAIAAIVVVVRRRIQARSASK